MAVEVGFAPIAERDLDSIFTHVRQENPSAAQRLVNELQERCLTLGVLPQSGTPVQGGKRRLVVGNYLIFYKVRPASGADPERVQVLRIFHGARNLPAAYQQ